MTLIEDFARVFQLPPAMRPYASLVATEAEMALVLRLRDQPMTADQIAAALDMPPVETERFIRRAFHRAIIRREMTEAGPLYHPANFYERMNILAMYENWADVPADVRESVMAWQLQEFIQKWLPTIRQIQAEPEAPSKIPNRDVLLLEEALAQVEAATEHVVVPCDCRAIVMACNRPVEVCIRLDEGARLTLEHGQGRRLSREECRAIVVDADRAGLMHTGLRAWQDQELFGFCNCCACDCYPFRAGRRLGLSQQWPRRHYIAHCQADQCIHCGVCVRRCHFGAFYRDGTMIEINGRRRQAVLFDPAKCYGCGLCATACSQGAIQMRPVDA